MNESFRYVFEHADAFTQLPMMDRISAIKGGSHVRSANSENRMILKQLSSSERSKLGVKPLKDTTITSNSARLKKL